MKEDKVFNTKQAKKRSKFQLDSDSEGDDVFMGFTHKGKKLLDDHDDFNEQISHSSEGEDAKDRGHLNEDMVNQLNFGGGEVPAEGRKKTRKEVFQEIMEKSKTFDQARKELNQINHDLVKELDGDFGELTQFLEYKKSTVKPLEEQLQEKREQEAKMTKKELDKKKLEDQSRQPTYQEILASLQYKERAVPLKTGKMTEKEQAMIKKKKLMEMEQEQLQDPSKLEAKGSDNDGEGG